MSWQKQSHLTRAQAEELSKRNAQAIIKGTDRLPSRGYTGNVWLPRLRKKIHHRSLLEKKILLEIDNFPLVVDIENEKLMVPYAWKGCKCHYVPDLLLKLRDGRIWLIEVKPSREVNEERNLAKFAAARAFCSSMGDHLRFGVLTGEADVRTVLPTHDGITLNERNRQLGLQPR